MTIYLAVFNRTSITGDEPQAVFRYGQDAMDFAKKSAAPRHYAEAGYTVEKVRLEVTEAGAMQVRPV